MRINATPVKINAYPQRINAISVKINATPVNINATPVNINVNPVNIKNAQLGINMMPLRADCGRKGRCKSIDSRKAETKRIFFANSQLY